MNYVDDIKARIMFTIILIAFAVLLYVVTPCSSQMTYTWSDMIRTSYRKTFRSALFGRELFSISSLLPQTGNTNDLELFYSLEGFFLLFFWDITNIRSCERLIHFHKFHGSIRQICCGYTVAVK